MTADCFINHANNSISNQRPQSAKVFHMWRVVEKLDLFWYCMFLVPIWQCCTMFKLAFSIGPRQREIERDVFNHILNVFFQFSPFFLLSYKRLYRLIFRPPIIRSCRVWNVCWRANFINSLGKWSAVDPQIRNSMTWRPADTGISMMYARYCVGRVSAASRGRSIDWLIKWLIVANIWVPGIRYRRNSRVAGGGGTR